MNEGVFLSKEELQELVDIRGAIDGFCKMLDAGSDSPHDKLNRQTEFALVLQPIARWLGDFVDKVYKRVG